MAAHNDRAQLAVRVTPSAKKSAFAGWTADEKGRPVLLVKLNAPPVDGKAMYAHLGHTGRVDKALEVQPVS